MSLVLVEVDEVLEDEVAGVVEVDGALVELGVVEVGIVDTEGVEVTIEIVLVAVGV